jgi:N-ethylmaleimide reductase
MHSVAFRFSRTSAAQVISAENSSIYAAILFDSGFSSCLENLFSPSSIYYIDKTNQMNRKNLFSVVNKHGVQFNNAIAMAPMTRSRAINFLPNDLMVKYYEQRASAGLIITEGNSPSPNGLGYARTPGIYTNEQILAWKKITEAVHAKDGKIFTQLMHVGRVAHSANTPSGSKILAPSAITAKGEMWTDSLGLQKMEQPHAMTLEDIQNTIDEFVQGAKNSIDAGFDGVELHGANGYLLEQFLNPHSNQRTDQFGGSIENRVRFVVEVTKSVVKAIGKEKVGVRLSPYGTFNDMPHYPEIFETYILLGKELSKLDILYLHVIEYSARASKEGQALLHELRQNFSNIFILNGGYTKERAELALQNNEADIISFGSPFIANPDLPFRLQHELKLNAPDQTTFYTPGEKGYLDYPVTKQEVLA